MSVKILGSTTGTTAEVEANYNGLRIVKRPLDLSLGGSYSKSLVSGTITAGLAANSNVFHFRNTSPDILCKIDRVTVSVTHSVSAGIMRIAMFPARNMTAVPTAGNSGQLTGNNGKLRTAFRASKLNTDRPFNGVTQASGIITIINTAALTTSGATLDTDPIGNLTGASTGAIGFDTLFVNEPVFENKHYPLICSEWEGFTLQATVPATSTWVMRVTTEWEEIPFHS